ncbi:MAG: DUF2283 domain-containing protein [Candidatus Zixiibacteriota bacterium]|jgi:uncharacterized protein YuzE
MKISYDKDADAMYIHFREGEFDHCKEPSPGVIHDLDANGTVLGIEILDVSRRTALQEIFDINISMPVSAK